MKIIPSNLGKLSILAAKESTKFALTGVRIELKEDGYRALVTDSKAGAIVEGNYVADANEYPSWDALTNAPNGATSALVPADFWRDTMAAATKLTKRCHKSILKESVAIVTGDKEVTIGATNLEQNPTHASRLVEGRFPPLDECIPRSKPLIELFVDPDYMIDMMQAAKQFASEEGMKSVRIALHPKCSELEEFKEREQQIAEGLTDDDGKPIEYKPIVVSTPIVVQSCNVKQLFTGIIMPLSDGGIPRRWKPENVAKPQTVPEPDEDDNDDSDEVEEPTASASMTVSAPIPTDSECAIASA